MAMKIKWFFLLILIILSACSPAATPTLSPEQLQAKWQSPLLVSFLVYGLCQQAQQEEPNPMAMVMFLGIIQDGLDKWTPVDDQAEIDETLRAQVKDLGGALAADDKTAAIEKACSQSEAVMKGIRDKANDDGLNDDEIRKIIETYQAKLKQWNGSDLGENVTDNLLGNLIIDETKQRGWSYSELARRADVSQSLVSKTVAGDISPSADFCIKVARAFGEVPEKLLRLAGILPASSASDDTVQQLTDIARNLPPEMQEQILDFAKFLYQQSREWGNKKAPEGAVVISPH